MKETVVLASGYFNPLHIGHIYYLNGARDLGDHLFVIINNDNQQLLKKGKIIMSETDRAIIVQNLKCVEDVMIAPDNDGTVVKAIDTIARNYKDTYNMVFANGGDRESAKEVPETFMCKRHGIKMVFDAGGNKKVESSSNINKMLGLE